VVRSAGGDGDHNEKGSRAHERARHPDYRNACIPAGPHEEKGNEEAGGFDINTFAGKIEGAYTILNDEINVNITKKPMFVPCSEIENQLRKYLS